MFLFIDFNSSVCIPSIPGAFSSCKPCKALLYIPPNFWSLIVYRHIIHILFNFYIKLIIPIHLFNIHLPFHHFILVYNKFPPLTSNTLLQFLYSLNCLLINVYALPIFSLVIWSSIWAHLFIQFFLASISYLPYFITSYNMYFLLLY